jgi:prepilin-type processing-associated H-X9-DG protein
MGTACTRTVDRVAAATGMIDHAEVVFEDLQDVRGGGVLFALPALLMNGLLKYSDKFFKLPDGYYSLYNVFLLLGFMALARVKNIERLRYQEPGEWGRILGLDRIPEVRTLREKVGFLSAEEKTVGQWSGTLAKDWMDKNPDAAGVLYVDGHVRTYYGSKNKLPRRYVSRQKLALRGVTDYWVNDALGRPFFTISSAFTTGLLDILNNEIVPRLCRDVPGQPDNQELKNDPYRSRFVLIFDREGYSPDFFQRMWERRIACQTYQKYPKENWPEAEFGKYTVKMPHGETIEMELAERGFLLGDKIWVREIHRKCRSGHQTSVLSTDFRADFTEIAAHMFSRWSQENFFKYMMGNFDIDALTGYKLYGFNETKQVVNPRYRGLDSKVKSLAGKLGRKKAKFHDLQINESGLTPKKMEQYEQKKGELREEIEFMQKELELLKKERKQTKKHIPFEELADEEQFYRIAPARKQLLDTVKMVAYRAETAMAQILRECLGRKDDTRPLLRQIYNADIDLVPDENRKTLTVRLHRLANQQSDRAVGLLCDHLNDTETIYPGTNFKLNFELVSN